MRLKYIFKKIPILGLCVLLAGISPATFSTGDNPDWIKGSRSADRPLDLMLLAEADEAKSDEEEPRSGTLVFPAAAEDDNAEKKCMTVCQRWGEDCMIDPRGVRKCRRTCKQFGEECF